MTSTIVSLGWFNSSITIYPPSCPHECAEHRVNLAGKVNEFSFASFIKTVYNYYCALSFSRQTQLRYSEGLGVTLSVYDNKLQA